MANGTCLLRQVERALKNVVGEARTRQGRKSLTSFLIVDAQSVKNTDSAREKGYDAGEKASRIKRHIAVDTQGLPHAVAVTTAEVTDRKGALLALGRCVAGLQDVQRVLRVCRSALCPCRCRTARRRRFKSPNAVSYTPLPPCPNAGWLSDPSPGLRNAGVCGKTASASSPPAYSSSTSPSSRFYSEDREQILRVLQPLLIIPTRSWPAVCRSRRRRPGSGHELR